MFSQRRLKLLTCLLGALFAAGGGLLSGHAQRALRAGRERHVVPRTWDAEALASLEVPLASGARKQLVSPDYYYRVPVRPIFKTYPVYAPGREPPGYMEWLARQEPQETFDPSKLKTTEDWIAAGREVFHSPIVYDVVISPAELRNPEWHKRIDPPVAKDGTLHFVRYGIREKGKVEVGTLQCGTCHSRLMPDGSVVDGGQSTFAFNRAVAWSYKTYNTEDFVRGDIRLVYGTPWLQPDPHAPLEKGSMDFITLNEEALLPGVVARNGTSPLFPTHVPNLFGLKDVKYLDATGLVRHRGVADLMRYAALAQGIDFVSSYYGPDSSEFIPNGEGTPPRRPDPATLRAKRYSDEQLYALALYIYSLRPPPNPNRFDAAAAKGRQIFDREGCAGCHPPPLYSNNKLTPVDGFKVPPEHFRMFGITPVSVGTDPGLALKTRRGTGYYKVPSLRGLWMRTMFGHGGDVATLEDWFDPRRLRDDYVPTGFRGYGVKTRAVKGHTFGLDLPEEERAALIAFLKTL